MTSCSNGVITVDPMVWSPVLIHNPDKSIDLEKSYWIGVKQSDPNNPAFEQRKPLAQFIEEKPVAVDTKTYTELVTQARQAAIYIQQLEEKARNCGGAKIQEQQSQGQ
jgi:hypothetical protein